MAEPEILEALHAKSLLEIPNSCYIFSYEIPKKVMGGVGFRKKVF